MVGEKWIVYWNEYAVDTYLYSSKVTFHSKSDVEFENLLMPPGTVIKKWYSKTNYQLQRIEPSLPMIDGESAYKLTVNVKGEEAGESDISARVLFRIVFMDRYEQEAGELIVRDKVTYFKCPLKTYSYQVELINAGTKHFHFQSMVIEEITEEEYEMRRMEKEEEIQSNKQGKAHGTKQKSKKNKKDSSSGKKS